MNSYCEYKWIYTKHSYRKPDIIDLEHKKFLKALLDKNLKKVKTFLDSGFDVNAKPRVVSEIAINVTGSSGSYLHMAPDLETTKLLIFRGANVNAVDDYNLTPLHYAVTYNKGLPVIRELLAAGADINAKNTVGFTPLTFAILFEYEHSVVELLNYHIIYDIPYISKTSVYLTTLDAALRAGEKCGKLFIKNTILLLFYGKPVEVINLEPYMTYKHYNSMVIYQEDCLNETSLMESFGIGRYLLRYYLLSNKRSTKPIYACDKSILDEISRMFPIYSNIILPYVENSFLRSELMSKFVNVRILSKETDTEEQVLLDPHCMENISEYLSNADLATFIEAVNTTESSPAMGIDSTNES